MRNRSTLALASVVTSMLAFGAPAEAGPEEWGYGCSMTAVSRDGFGWTGVISGGPWFVRPHTASVSMTCRLQRWDGEGWTTIAMAESSPTPGTTVVPPSVVGFGTGVGGGIIGGARRALSPTNLQMCTEITVYEHGWAYAHQVDADDNPNNGAQCEKEERADGELVYVTLFPPQPHGRPCVWLDDENLPEAVPDKTCGI